VIDRVLFSQWVDPDTKLPLAAVKVTSHEKLPACAESTPKVVWPLLDTVIDD
jgi:hypothetical protein